MGKLKISKKVEEDMMSKIKKQNQKVKEKL